MNILWCPSSLLLGFPASGIRAFRVWRGVFPFGWSKSIWWLSTVSFADKDLIFPIWFVFTNYFLHCVKESIKKMAGESQTTVKSMNPHPMKIDVVKFDGMNNFRMWWYEVMMHWRHQTLKSLYDWKKSRRRLLKRIETRWIGRMWSDKVLFDARYQVSCAT